MNQGLWSEEEREGGKEEHVDIAQPLSGAE